MAVQLVKYLMENFQNYVENLWTKRDKRIDGWFMMDNPLIMYSLVFLYIIISNGLGSWLMRNRKPIHLKKTMIVYNIAMVIINGWLNYQAWMTGWGTDYTWFCQPLDRSTSARALKMAGICWVYFILKMSDWIDTMFFILRKKFSHVSFLHVFHHANMVIGAWFVVRFMPGGHVTFIGLVNTGVHVIMHTYYAMAAFGEKYKKYLWWKRYVTIIQLAQFAILISHSLVPYILRMNCEIIIPELMGIGFVHGVIFLYLFLKFYKETYILTPNICYPEELSRNRRLLDKTHKLK